MTERLSLSAQLHTMFRTDASALMTAQEGERRAYGVSYKQQQEAGPKDEAGGPRADVKRSTTSYAMSIRLSVCGRLQEGPTFLASAGPLF